MVSGGAPPARREELIERLHGVDVADPYRWLEDGTTEETRAWVREQNDHTRALLDALPDRAGLHARLVELLDAPVSTGCRVAGGQVFSLERGGGRPTFSLVVRSARAPGPARVIVDPAAEVADGTGAIDWFEPSPDGRLVAYGLSEGGSESSVLRIVDVATGDHMVERIPDTKWSSVAWLPDSSRFAYARYPAGSHYGQRLHWHDVGSDGIDDPVFWDDTPDPSAMVEVRASAHGRHLVVLVHEGWSRNDVQIIDVATGATRVVVTGLEARFDLSPRGDRLIGRTTLDAPRGRVVSVPLDDPAPDRWVTLVPETDSPIEEGGVHVGASTMFVRRLRSGVAALHRFALDGSGEEAIPLPGGLVAFAGFDGDEHDDDVFFQVESFALPAGLYRWTPHAGVEAWGDGTTPLDGTAFSLRQVSFASSDGADVPMFVLSEGDRTPEGPSRCLLTGYGGFAIAATPVYAPLAVALVERGWVFADAGIRGGFELGEEWHLAGMREHKQQVFDDFRAASDWLVAEGWTDRSRLALRGGSNGGLLVGAALTQWPAMARAVHCAVPLLDMLRYHLFLVARLWIPEYGDPDVAEEFAWLHAYSPYHRVLPGTCYPSVLFTTAEEDGRVDPCHARKMAALLQHATSCGDERPILLRVEDRAGHGAGKPTTKLADELADVAAFLEWQLA